MYRNFLIFIFILRSSYCWAQPIIVFATLSGSGGPGGPGGTVITSSPGSPNPGAPGGIQNMPHPDRGPAVVVGAPNISGVSAGSLPVVVAQGEINSGVYFLNQSAIEKMADDALNQCTKDRIESYLQYKINSKGCQLLVKLSVDALKKMCLAECPAPEPNKYICGIGVALSNNIVNGAVKSGLQQGCTWAVKKGEDNSVQLYLSMKTRVLNDIDQLSFWFKFLNTTEGAQWFMGKLTDIQL